MTFVDHRDYIFYSNGCIVALISLRSHGKPIVSRTRNPQKLGFSHDNNMSSLFNWQRSGRERANAVAKGYQQLEIVWISTVHDRA